MKFTIVLIAILTMSGCATQTYMMNTDAVNKDTVDTKPTYEDRQEFFLYGIGQDEVINAAKICGSAENVIKVESELTFTDGFLNLLTSGIYTPRTAKIYCKKK
jgi:hypothetical protein